MRTQCFGRGVKQDDLVTKLFIAIFPARKEKCYAETSTIERRMNCFIGV